MRMKLTSFLSVLVFVMAFSHANAVAQAPPREWMEKETGHRVIRLSGDEGGSSLYFHQNTDTPKGDKLVFDTRAGIVAIDLSKLGKEPVKAELVVPEARTISVAWRTPDVYYRKGAENLVGAQRRESGTLYATNVETK